MGRVGSYALVRRMTASRLLFIVLAVVAIGAEVGVAQTTAPTAAPAVPAGTLSQRAQSLVGFVVLMGVAVGIGRLRGSRSLPPGRLIAWGVALQFVFGAIVVWTRTFLTVLNATIDALLGFTKAGAGMVFGNLIQNNVPVGAPGAFPPMDPIAPGGSW